MSQRLRNALRLAASLTALTLSLHAQAPPLIDRQILLANPDIANAQISPDGRYIAFLKSWKDTLNIYVKKINEPPGAMHQLTAEARRPITEFQWTQDSKYLCFIKDNNGDGNFNLYTIDPDARAAKSGDAPEARNLTGLKGARIGIVNAPRNDPDTLFITINARDKNWPDLYALKISSGRGTLLRRNTGSITGWVFDLAGQLRLATRSAENGDQEILSADPDGFKKVYSCSVFETCTPARFHKDGKRVYLLTNSGDAADLAGLALFNPATGKLEPAETDPLKRVDMSSAVFSDATDELVQTNYLDDRMRHYFRDKTFESDFHSIEAKLPNKEISANSVSEDEQLWLVTAASDTEPGETYLFNRKTAALTLQFRVREDLPRQALAPMQSIHYPSSDGLEIPAYLTLPVGVPPKGLPTLVIPHAGPWERDTWGFNATAQFFANRGYAVLMPNYRGSSGYGKKFLNAGNGEWGRKMQDDITWGVKYLAAQGIADADRVGIIGAEYGGYAALAGVAFTPDLYKAAVDIAGPSALFTMLRVIPSYWEGGRRLMYTRVADPNTPEGQTWLKERSPFYSADKIKAPLFIVQGGNDPQATRGAAEQIVAGLRDRGVPVQYMLAPDEGHGFQRPVNNMAMFMAAEKFLAEHLGGRYQESATPEITSRLAEITIDPKRVVLPAKVDTATVGLPKPAMDLTPGSIRYQMRINTGGKDMGVVGATEIKEDNGAWAVTESVQTAAGPVTDTSIIEKGTLVVKKRITKQGSTSINVDFSGGKALGSMLANGQNLKIAADIGGELFADFAGAPQSIAALPLAEGYAASFLNFDPGTSKVSVMELKVPGSETVTVPAGTFDTYRAEVTPAEGGTDVWILWIAKNTHQMVKMLRVMAATNGAAVTTEMLP